ncbi:isoleucyl-tRNA synthetase [Achromobacter spanius]
MRNVAQDMESHMLNDVGAPQWLVNEATVRRELTRLRHVDFIRW